MKKIIAITLIILLMAVSSAIAGSLTKLRPVQLQDGVVMIGLIPAGYVDAEVLTAGAAVAHAVPTDAVYVLISCTGDVWVNIGGAAAIPSTAVTNGSSSSLNPALRSLGTATTIELISAAANKCSLEFFKQ